jgi:hypothetical protein
MIVRDSVDILPFVVRHHLEHGVDVLYVIDHCSVDGTRRLLARLVDGGLPLRWRADDGAYEQTRMAGELAAEATEAGADWIVAIDVDEFWLVPGGLKHYLAAPAASDALSLDVLNFVQWRFATARRLAGLGTMLVRPATPIPKRKYESARAAGAHPPWIVRRFGRKTIARAGIELTEGAHHTVDPAVTVERRTDGACLHVPIRSRRSIQGKPRFVAVRDEAAVEAVWRENTWLLPNRLGRGASAASLVVDTRLARIALRHARASRSDLASVAS